MTKSEGGGPDPTPRDVCGPVLAWGATLLALVNVNVCGHTSGLGGVIAGCVSGALIVWTEPTAEMLWPPVGGERGGGHGTNSAPRAVATAGVNPLVHTAGAPLPNSPATGAQGGGPPRSSWVRVLQPATEGMQSPSRRAIKRMLSASTTACGPRPSPEPHLIRKKKRIPVVG